MRAFYASVGISPETTERAVKARQKPCAEPIPSGGDAASESDGLEVRPGTER